MPDELKKIESDEDRKLSLQKAFQLFQKQSEILEKSHRELQQKLDKAQLSLARKNRELASRISEIEDIKEKLSGVLSSITDAVFLVDLSGRIDLVNHAASQMFGCDFSEGSSLDAIVELREHWQSRDRINDLEVPINVDDEKRHFLLSVLPMADTANRAGYKVVSLKDITEQRRLQESLSREDRLAALGKVAASVAHEIRNPLGAIEGFARLLERDLKDSPASQRLASKTVYGARQLNSVVSNLLNYARELKPNSEKNDLNQLVLEAVEFVRPIAQDHKVRLDIELSENPAIAAIDSVQFKQVITNIVLNAIDACPIRSGGHIVISSKLKKGKVLMQVTDNGKGVSKNRKERIFEPFFTMKEGGVGLGLSLCQKIIESHNGRIYENGLEDEGARFIIEMPEAT